MYLPLRSFADRTPDVPAEAKNPQKEAVQQRGYQPMYHQDIVNHCPGCGKSQWYVGRFSAECAHCETALPLTIVSSQPMQPRFTESFSKTAMAA